MEARGHRLAEHTADLVIEAWGPTRAACLEECVLGLAASTVEVPLDTPTAPLELLVPRVHDRYHDPDHVGDGSVDGEDEDGDDELLVHLLEAVCGLLDSESRVPVAIEVRDAGAGALAASCTTVAVDQVVVTGPAPKGVARSETHLSRDGDRWRAHALVDV